MKSYKVLIIDDERDIIRKYLQDSFQGEIIVYEAPTVNKGLKLINAKNPDIIILNAIINKQGTFKLLDKIQIRDFEIIIVSFKNTFALKALKYQVTGYILKPIKRQDLKDTFNRVIDNINKKKEIFLLAEGILSQQKKTNYLAIPTTVIDVKLIKIDNILYCEAKKGHTVFNMADGNLYKSVKGIGIYEEFLKKRFFFRIHKKYLINLMMIQRINKIGGYSCELLNGVSLPISSRKNIPFRKYLNLV